MGRAELANKSFQEVSPLKCWFPPHPSRSEEGGKKTSVKIWSHWGMLNWCLSSASLPLSQFSPPFNSLPFETAGLGWPGPPARPRVSYRHSVTGDRRWGSGGRERKEREAGGSPCVDPPVWAEGFIHCDEGKTNSPPNKQALPQPQSLLHGCILFLGLWVSLEPLFLQFWKIL